MKQRSGVCFLTVGILVFSGLCYATSNHYPMISSILNEARELRISGDVYEADALLTRAQRIAPRSADVYLEMAYLRKAQGDYTGLREVVDFGSDIADGPPASIAQLRILRDKLMVLLPLDSETPFQLPPAVAANNDSIPEKIAKRSTAVQPPSNTESQEPLSESGIDAHSVNGGGKGSGTRKPMQLGQEVRAEQTIKDTNVQRSDASNGQKLDDSAPSKAKKIEASVTSAERQRPVKELENSGGSTVGETVPSRPKVKRVSAQYAGAGILAKSQSGSWISRGSIERDY